MDYESLLQFAETDRQTEILKTVIEHKNNRVAAEKLSISIRSVCRAIKRVRLIAARQGHSPDHDMTRTVPEGFHLKGTSTLYGDDGAQKLQWVKTSIDHERMHQLMLETIEALKDEIPKARPITKPQHSSKDLLNLYVITDYHLGAKSWPDETGEAWDTDIAEDLLVKWFATAISLAPDTNEAVLCNLGDWLHFDGLDAVTPTSHHVLDADTRFQKIVRVTIRLFRQVIVMLLQKHQQVHVIMAEGNHDLSASAWMREMFNAFYENEPRITVDINADIYYCHEFGQTSLFFHHGHKRKPENIDKVFASKYRSVFGRTKFSYGHMGHMHHDKKIESSLMVIDQYRTLAAKDSHASRGGWESGRDARAITYHRDYGKVGELVISPEMTYALQN